jgi:hypothetical protein
MLPRVTSRALLVLNKRPKYIPKYTCTLKTYSASFPAKATIMSEPAPLDPTPQEKKADAEVTAQKDAEEKPLPKLTPSEFRQYNRYAETMDYYVR